MFGQVLRFGGVGGLATLVHVLTAMAAQAVLPLSAQAANFTGFLTAVVVSYVGHARFTFGAPVRSGSQAARFVALSLLGLLASSGTVWLVTTRLGLGFTVAMAIVAVVVPAVTFLAMRSWVFVDRGEASIALTREVGLCLAIPATMLAVFWGRLVNHDVAWYLFATRDWLAGAALYVDLVEVNPPLNFYLTLPALLIADLLGVSDANGHYLAFALLLGGSLLWSGAILRSGFGLTSGQRCVLLTGFGLAALLPSLNGIGQREQVLFLSLLPWALREAAPHRATTRQLLTSAGFAAVGMCLKPYFVLLPLAVTGLKCIEERSARPVLSAANMVFLVSGIAYVAYVRLVHPAYLTQIVPIGLEVYGAYGKSAVEVLSGIGVPLALVTFALLFQWRSGAVGRPVLVFAALAFGGLLSYFLQGTGFSYHKLPFIAFGAVACLFILVESADRTSRIVAAMALFGLALGGLQQGLYRNSAVAEIGRIGSSLGPINRYMALSSHVYVGPPAAIVLQADWASSYPANWLVPGAINRLEQTDCATSPDTCERLRAILARNRTANIADIRSRKPELLLVDRSSGYFDRPAFDWLGFMAEDPAWEPVFAQYRQVAETGRFLYFLRNP